ncbi:MAG: hypothetical protein ABGX20_23830 [Bacillus sp. (in: firmicutes)]|jgi:hypothetical protein
MKDKIRWVSVKTVLHKVDEEQNKMGMHEKCLASTSLPPNETASKTLINCSHVSS